jgi:type IV pilus biogenesis protein PilP
MHAAVAIFATFFACSIAHAQATGQEATVGNALDIEAQAMMKKLAEEARKANQNAQPAAAPVLVRPVKEKPLPPAALEIYGTDNAYRARLQMGGNTVSVRVGSMVGDYVVSAISPRGVWLARPAKGDGKPRAKSSAPVAHQQVFAPFLLQ